MAVSVSAAVRERMAGSGHANGTGPIGLGGLVRHVAMGGQFAIDLVEHILAVARHRRGFAMAGGAAVGDALRAAIEHQGGIVAGGTGQHRHRAIEHLLAVAIQGDDVSVAEALADDKGMARVDHGDVGDGGIADINRGDRLVEGHGMHRIHGDGDARRECGRGNGEGEGGGEDHAAHGNLHDETHARVSAAS